MHEPDAPDPSPRPPRADADRAGEADRTSAPDLFAQLPGTIWTTDTQLVVTFVEGRILRNLGITPDRVIGRSLADLLLDGRDDHPIIHGHLTALDGHETSVRIEWGGRVYSARIGPIVDGSGRVTGCVGCHQEIAWLPDEEGTLREPDVRLRRVIDSNMIGILFGDAEGRVTDANDAFLQLAGFTREDLTGDGISWTSLMPVEAQQRHLQALEEILATGRCSTFETEIIRKDGERVTVLVGAARLSARRREGVAFVLDITERKRTVRGLRAELTCADALLDAGSVEQGTAAVLTVLAGALDWKSAALWTVTGGVRRLIAQAGSDEAAQMTLIAARVLHVKEPVWLSAQAALALPLVADGTVVGALVLVGRIIRARDGEPDATTERIVARLAKFVGAANHPI